MIKSELKTVMNKNINNTRFLSELAEVSKKSKRQKSKAARLMPKTHGLNNNFYMLH